MPLPGPTFIVREPARLSLRIWERGLSGALTVVRIARELLDPPEEGAGQAPEPARRAQEGNGGPPAATRPAGGTATRRAPARAPVREPVPEPELVAELADEGAEEGAGAEVHIDEPWDGYDAMTAPEVSRRLAREGGAAAAAVKLYEAAGKGRTSILQAADRELAR